MKFRNESYKEALKKYKGNNKKFKLLFITYLKKNKNSNKYFKTRLVQLQPLLLYNIRI